MIMGRYVIKPIGDIIGTVEYETIDAAKEFAATVLESYEHGFEIVNLENNSTVHRDEREEVSRTDLIDWD